jgi:hypothetical protein
MGLCRNKRIVAMKLRLLPPLGLVAGLCGAGITAFWLIQADPFPIAGLNAETGSSPIAQGAMSYFALPAPFDAEDAVARFANRPLLAEGRRTFQPRPTTQEQVPVVAPEPVLEPVETTSEPLPLPQMRLIGMMESGGIRRALILDESTGQQIWLTEGEAIQGWILIEVGNSTVRLKAENTEIAFNLFEETVP